jgi:hypothetical protein
MWWKGFSGDKKMVDSEIKCPNCFKELPTKLKRKKECPHCGKFIFVRKSQLVTEDESIIIDWLDFFEEFEISRHPNLVEFEEAQILRKSSRQGIYETRERLREKLGYQPTVPDTIWAILNEFLIKYTGDDLALEQIHRAMARLASSEVKDPTQYVLEADKLQEQLKKRMLEELEIVDDEESIPPRSGNKRISWERLDYIKRLRKNGEIDKAETMLMKEKGAFFVLDELRKIASIRARIAKRRGDWETVIKHLEGYTKYAAKWRSYSVRYYKHAPYLHTARDNKLLEEAKKKLGG